MKTCTQCQHRGDDVDVTGACYFCARNTTADLARFGHLMLKALGRKAPAVDAETKAETKKEAKAKIYEVTPTMLGCADAREVFKALSQTLVTTKEDRERAMSALTIVRAAAFKHPQPWTYTVSDAVVTMPMLSTHTPAQIGAAIVAASKTPFWAEKKSIPFSSLPKHLGELLAAAPSRVGTATKERRAELMASIDAGIARLADAAPIDAADFEEVDRSRMDVGSLEAMLTKINAVIGRVSR